MASTIHQLPTCGLAQEDRKFSCSSKELSWKEFFRDPSKWWDNRYAKPSPKHPDFKHKFTGEPLWMDSRNNPSWIHTELRDRGFIGEHCHATLSTAQIDSFVTSLRACARNKDLNKGISLHHDLVHRDLLKPCSDALVTMYAQCGELGKAKVLLNRHKSCDVITWTALIAGYAREGQGQKALDCLEQMQFEGISPNAVTYVGALKACGMIQDIDRGQQIHKDLMRQGLLHNDAVLGGALMDMYSKCGAISEARKVFDEVTARDVITWSVLVAGYAQEGQAEQALNCLTEMQRDGILPDAVTYVCALKACATIKDAYWGKQIHDEIARQGVLQNNIAVGGALVDMYANCGAVSEARQVLEELPFRNISCWNAMISAFAQQGEAGQAIDCFEQMHREGILPNTVTYICALKACAMMRALDRGKQIHEEIARRGFSQKDIVLGNALVDMYAKCGNNLEARHVLEGLPSRDVYSWNALIAGYAQGGEAEQALDCLEQMQQEGILPDAVTCACVLNVCSHQGLVEEAQAFFVSMSTKYGVKPNLICYTCMIDLLGRAGHVGKVVRLIQEMPSSDDAAIWHALLGVCQKWADVNVGEWAFEQAKKLDKSIESAYVLLGNIYAATGMEEKAKNIKAMRISKKACEKTGMAH